MNNNYYNIAWCDDKIDALWDKEMQEEFMNQECHLCYKGKNMKGLFEYLANNSSLVDGVIIDFNINESSDVPQDDLSDASGFIMARTKREEYPDIPFYLYSAYSAMDIKDTLARVHINDDYFMGETDRPKHRRRFFTVGKIEELLKSIKEEIDFMKTPEYQLRRKYCKGFSAIDDLGLDSRSVIEILLMSDSNPDAGKLLDKLNTLRCQVENIFFHVLPSANSFPYGVELNAVPEILAGNHKEYKLNDGAHIIDKPMRKALNFFITMLQDGSHEKPGLKVELREYIKHRSDVLLCQSFALFYLDLSIWAIDYLNIYKDNNQIKKVPKEVASAEVCVVQNQNGIFFIEKDGEKYLLQHNYKVDIVAGNNVRLKKAAKNTDVTTNDVYKWFVSWDNWEKLSSV